MKHDVPLHSISVFIQKGEIREGYGRRIGPVVPREVTVIRSAQNDPIG